MTTHSDSSGAEKPNQLIHEKSPYLLQHAYNPVKWFAWSTEAFDKAKNENKPIFLSIGYSTCHWCHVMEEESFENDEIAAIINENFIPIKVDREERPDIDQIYMSFVLATNGSGGWPMTVFLTPERTPFYGGTYYPPKDSRGMVGLATILEHMKEAWKEKPDEIRKSGESFIEYFNSRLQTRDTSKVGDGALTHAFRSYSDALDPVNGGFGRAPKFPSPHTLDFLLQYHKSERDNHALHMVELTLKQMAKGGIRDHLEGGFHRYSVDAQWFVPHFEKMLYDQALLLGVYSDVFQITQDEFYKDIINQTAQFLIKHMRSDQGVFFSAYDADSFESTSSTNKREGAYYVWTHDEVQEILEPDEFKFYANYYGIDNSGNVDKDPHNEFRMQNILSIKKDLNEVSRELNLSINEALKIINACNAKLVAKRRERPLPHLDDKILTDWNALTMTSLIKAYFVTQNDEYRQAAIDAGEWIVEHMIDIEGRLMHRYRDGEVGIAGKIDDYAFLIESFMYLYEASYDEKWLRMSIEFADKMINDFEDKKRGGFFMTAENDGEYLILRPKEYNDGAIPSGYSTAMSVLFKLSSITQNDKYAESANKALSHVAEHIKSSPISFGKGLTALSWSSGEVVQIVISGDSKSQDFKEFERALNNYYLPRRVLLNRPEGKLAKFIDDIAPFISSKSMDRNKVTAYVCKNYVCDLPTSDLNVFKAQLSDI